MSRRLNHARAVAVVTSLTVVGLLASPDAHAERLPSRATHQAHYTPTSTIWITRVDIWNPTSNPSPTFQLVALEPSWKATSHDAELVEVPGGLLVKPMPGISSVVIEVEQPASDVLAPPLVRADIIQKVAFDHYDAMTFEPAAGIGLEKRVHGVRSKRLSRKEIRHQFSSSAFTEGAVYYRGPPHPKGAVLG